MFSVALLLGSLLTLQPSAEAGVPTGSSLTAKAADAPTTARPPDDPTIFCIYPPDGRIGDRVIVFGTNFDIGALAYFGAIPSVPTFIFSSPDEVPGYGRLSVLVAPVPPNLLQGNTPLKVRYQGQTTNSVPFRVRLFGGSYNQGPDPELWCSEPEEGDFLSPIVLLGYDFTEESVPYFGSIASINLGTFTLPEPIPLFGTFSAMLTFVPSFFPGTVNLNVRRNGDVTESVRFRIKR